MEVILGEVLPVGTPRHFGHQLASRISESLPRPTVAVGGVAQGCGNQDLSIGFTLFHQVQCPQIVGGVAWQHVHRGNQLGVRVHHNGRLVPVKALAAALATVAHLWIMHRHHPVPAHTLLDWTLHKS